jgi:hypothetical protein
MRSLILITALVALILGAYLCIAPSDAEEAMTLLAVEREREVAAPRPDGEGEAPSEDRAIQSMPFVPSTVASTETESDPVAEETLPVALTMTDLLAPLSESLRAAWTLIEEYPEDLSWDDHWRDTIAFDPQDRMYQICGTDFALEIANDMDWPRVIAFKTEQMLKKVGLPTDLEELDSLTRTRVALVQELWLRAGKVRRRHTWVCAQQDPDFRNQYSEEELKRLETYGLSDKGRATVDACVRLCNDIQVLPHKILGGPDAQVSVGSIR